MEKEKAKQRMGKENGRWKGGKSSDYRRRVMDAKPGDGTIIHHKDGTKTNNSKNNFKKLKPGNGISARGKHNQEHPHRHRAE